MKPIKAYCVVRGSAHGEWLDADTIRAFSHDSHEAAKAIDRLDPSSARDLPIIRIVSVIIHAIE